MTHSQVCIDLVASFEGVKLAAYRDQRGILTIGYGHTYNVGPGDTCTEEQARKWLFSDLMVADRCVNQAVKVQLSQNQFDACVSLCYNIGAHAFGPSTLVRKLNAGDLAGAASEFLKWEFAGSHVSQGLVNRRIAERKLFLADVPVTQGPQ